MIVDVNVDGQSLRWYDRPPKIADKSIQFVKFRFSFSPEWVDYQITAQFTQNGTYNMLLTDGMCCLPSELTTGQCSVSVFGCKPGEAIRATVIPLKFHLEKSGFVGDGQTPIPPTPDLYAQLLDEIKQNGTGSSPNGFGISPAAINLLISILKEAAFFSDQSKNIQRLKEELYGLSAPVEPDESDQDVVASLGVARLGYTRLGI